MVTWMGDFFSNKNIIQNCENVIFFFLNKFFILFDITLISKKNILHV